MDDGSVMGERVRMSATCSLLSFSLVDRLGDEERLLPGFGGGMLIHFLLMSLNGS